MSTPTLIQDKTKTMTTAPFSPRGIGSGSGVCFICGHKPMTAHAELAGFTGNTRHEGELAHRVFRAAGMETRLDWREHEPTWVQVKIGACQAHAMQLSDLDAAIRANSNQISTPLLAESTQTQVTHFGKCEVRPPGAPVGNANLMGLLGGPPNQFQTVFLKADAGGPMTTGYVFTQNMSEPSLVAAETNSFHTRLVNVAQHERELLAAALNAYVQATK